MSLTIYSYPNSWRVNKSLIAAQYVGVTINVPAFEVGKDNKTDAFRAKNPTGKVPVMDTPSGPIFESNAIARYVSRLRTDAGLLGKSAYEQAQVDQWIDFSVNEIEPPRNTWYYTVLGYLPNNPKAINESKKDLESALKVIDNHLLSNTFFVGNSITLADINIFCAMVDAISKLLTEKFLSAFPNFNRWFATIAAQPQVIAVVGKSVLFAKEEAQPPKAAGKGDKPAAKEEKKAEKKEDKPAAAKPAPKPAAADDDDDEDKPRPKPKNILDDLPASPMVLDTVKKLAFSVRPFKTNFFEELWPQFDASGYTWFTLHYKYNSDNKVFYMTGNAVGGFIQRSDAARKFSMGVLNIIGNEDEETGPFSIEGAWLFRGPGVTKEMLEENPDSEYYEWRKVDTTKPEERKAVEDQFLATKLSGQAVLDRRYFK